VTTFASRPDLETWRRLEALGGEIPAPQLKHVWCLDVGRPIDAHHRTETLDVRRIEREVVAALAELEAGGYTHIEYGSIDLDTAVTDALRCLLELDVDAGHASPLLEGDEGRVMLVAPVGGFSHPDSVAAGIENEAAKEDNLAKLAEPQDALHRHLVVRFDGSSGTAFMNVHFGSKGRLPRLPDPITTAWALASDSLLATTPPVAWVHHRIPQSVFEAPEKWLCDESQSGDA
jgi:hypothetical protein